LESGLGFGKLLKCKQQLAVTLLYFAKPPGGATWRHTAATEAQSLRRVIIDALNTEKAATYTDPSMIFILHYAKLRLDCRNCRKTRVPGLENIAIF